MKTPPPSPLRPVLEVVGLVVVMVLLLGAVGFGIGTLELLVWLVLVAGGIALITWTYFRRRARWYAEADRPSG